MKQYHKGKTRRRINSTIDVALFDEMVRVMKDRGVEPRDGHLASILDEAVQAWLDRNIIRKFDL